MGKTPFIQTPGATVASNNAGLMGEAARVPEIFLPNTKLVVGLGYRPRSNKRPACLRVVFVNGKKGKGGEVRRKEKSTVLTLENKNFLEQYRRAVKLLADFKGVPIDDPVRDAMEATSAEFLRHYGLTTKTVTVTVTYEQVVVDGSE